MTINKIYGKLRRYNKNNYISLFFCNMMSVVLVTSYALIYLSPTVQTILPAGGDSRKQGTMIFASAIIGCAIFTIYAASLFYRYKSRETGIFLALGADKNWLRKIIFSDVIILSAASCSAGLLISMPISFLIWKIFQLVIVDTKEMTYQFGWMGLLLGIIFSVFASICIFILGIRFIGRTDIINILNEHRKSETIPKVKRWYGIAGILLIAAGFFLGFILPSLLISLYEFYLPSVWNGFYILAVLGIYKLMVYVVVQAKRGKHPGRYYKNIISTSMMRFMGRQTVKNMCVIILLIFGGLFAIFYTPVIITGIQDNIKNNPYDFSYTYEMRINQIKGAELEKMAEAYDVAFTDFHELASIDIIADGNQWYYPTSGQAYSEYVEKYAYKRFYKASDLEKLTGETMALEKGEYKTIVSSEYSKLDGESGCILTHPVSGESHKYINKGNAVFNGNLITNNNIEDIFVMNDQDYDAYEKTLPIENKYTTIIFNVPQWEVCYDFASALKNEIIRRTPKDAAVASGYDHYMKAAAEAAGEIYFMDESYPPGVGTLELSPENSNLYAMWRYYPTFKPLQQQDSIKNMAVFFMLFIYIGIICFAAIGIISYTRGITIAINYSQVFKDLKCLGADRKYISFCIKSQLKKIFFYPFVVGSIIIYLFTALIFVTNDALNKITVSERHALMIDFLIILCIGIYIFAVYRLTYRKFTAIIENS